MNIGKIIDLHTGIYIKLYRVTTVSKKALAIISGNRVKSFKKEIVWMGGP
jgi:hypothetical protein